MSEYPSEKVLESIRNLKDFEFEFLKEEWNTQYGKVEQKDDEYIFITGGWSGNEDIILALRQNREWWYKHFYAEIRGGKWVFKVGL